MMENNIEIVLNNIRENDIFKLFLTYFYLILFEILLLLNILK